MMYEILIAPIVRRMNEDKASRFAMRYFKFIGRIPGERTVNRWIHGNRASGLQKEVFGLQFYNPLGLGAGLDREASLYNDLNDLGFSFSEIGPLDGKGIRKAVSNIQKDSPDDILGACIENDFLSCFTLAYDFCDFFVVEVPEKNVDKVLDPLLDARLTYEEYKPLVAKLPESISEDELAKLTDYCLMSGIDGIQARSLDQIQKVRNLSKGRIPIMANCHVKSMDEVQEQLQAGASLIEIRMGLVTQGPSLVRKILKHLEKQSINTK